MTLIVVHAWDMPDPMCVCRHRAIDHTHARRACYAYSSRDGLCRCSRFQPQPTKARILDKGDR